MLTMAGLMFLPVVDSVAQKPPANSSTARTQTGPAATVLQLEVFLNGVSSKYIASFSVAQNGALSIDAEQLKNVGILPQPKARVNGLVEIVKLKGVSYRYDEANQSIYFTATDAAMAPHVIDAQPKAAARVGNGTSTVGGLVNYSLYTSTGGDAWQDIGRFSGVSGAFEARVFGPLGLLSSTQIVSYPSDDLYGATRLDSQWSYSDEQRLMTYRLGDVITGGLAWTRPTRLGGIQIQRNFGLRPDMVTMPIPQLSGSAAVPSTVDVYIDNARRVSSEVPAGPFTITNIPVVTGDGTARLVVRDALGREAVSETPFYASSSLLAADLFDVSAEIGFARGYYGTRSNDYDDRPVGSATMRYGLSDAVTIEAHGEGGASLLNGGFGGVFNLDDRGVGSIAASASSFSGNVGFQLAGSVETEFWGMHLFARSQRSFGDYNDIASVTDENSRSQSYFFGPSSRPPRSLDQISLSVPLKFDPATLNFTYTHLATADGDESKIVGATANRPFGQNGNVFLTAYRDLASEHSFGIFVGLSFSFGDRLSGSTGVSSNNDGVSVTADLVKSQTSAIGSAGWRVRGAKGANDFLEASGAYRAPFANVEGSVSQYGGKPQATAQIDGAVAVAGGDVFLTNRIDDAFAVIDAGAPDVAVQLENRPIGKTGRSGTLLIPGLRSYDANKIDIDPTNLPLDAQVDSTTESVVPKSRSGTVVNFGVKAQAHPKLFSLKLDDGSPVEAGATGTFDAGKRPPFIVGYDGQIYVELAGDQNHVVIDQPTRGRCEADLSRPTRNSDGAGSVAICGAIP